MWVNCHNMFDAASGFGGYRQSGYGRDGGKEVWSYVSRLMDMSVQCILTKSVKTFPHVMLIASFNKTELIVLVYALLHS